MIDRAHLALAAALALSACRQNDDPAAADELYARVAADDYRGWERAPGYDARTPSDAPHSDQVEIFVNDVMAAALEEEGLDAWPTGSIVAKDGYADDGTLELTALMEKREDGWFYAEYGADGTAKYSGQPAICVDCHASGSDAVRAFTLP